MQKFAYFALSGILSLLLSLMGTGVRASDTQTYHIVFDLDWTLFYPIRDPSTVPASELITFEGQNAVEHYRMADHVPWLIESLVSRPQVKVSFFSGGTRERNHFLLKQIHLSHRRTALDIAAHVLSIEHLTVVSQDTSLKFSDRNKKELTRWIPNLDLSRTLLVDDQPKFSIDAAVLNALGELNFRNEFNPALVGLPYEARNFTHWHTERNRLLILGYTIARALESDQKRVSPFTHAAIRTLTDANTGQWLDLDHPEMSELLAQALQARERLKLSSRSFTGKPRTCQEVFAN